MKSIGQKLIYVLLYAILLATLVGVLLVPTVHAAPLATIGTINEFNIPTAGSMPNGIATGPDGNLWFTEIVVNKIGRITPAGVITEFNIPTAGSEIYSIAAGPDGNLWFAENGGNKIGRITPAGVITEFNIPTAGSRPFGITTGSDGNLWFTEHAANKIGRITPAGVITEFPIPTASSLPCDITAGPDGDLWFTERNASKIGRFQLLDPVVLNHTLQAAYAGLGPSSFTVTFNKDVSVAGGATGADSATNPANYRIINKGANHTLETASCSAVLGGDDSQVTSNGVTYISNTAVVNLSSALPAGFYRLFVCGTTSIVDLAGNALAGDGVNSGTDFPFDFTVQAVATLPAAASKASSLPATGFAPGRIPRLPAQPAEKAYSQSDFWLEIPKLGLKMDIVGVPQVDGDWDVTWLGNTVGWLDGSAYPTWEGKSVITGHVWNADNTPGIFADLKTLKYGDQILIHAFGQVYTYEVRESKRISSNSVQPVMKHEALAWLTLVTCEDYRVAWNTYSGRRMVRGVLVSIK